MTVRNRSIIANKCLFIIKIIGVNTTNVIIDFAFYMQFKSKHFGCHFSDTAIGLTKVYKND